MSWQWLGLCSDVWSVMVLDVPLIRRHVCFGSSRSEWLLWYLRLLQTSVLGRCYSGGRCGRTNRQLGSLQFWWLPWLLAALPNRAMTGERVTWSFQAGRPDCLHSAADAAAAFRQPGLGFSPLPSRSVKNSLRLRLRSVLDTLSVGRPICVGSATRPTVFLC